MDRRAPNQRNEGLKQVGITDFSVILFEFRQPLNLVQNEPLHSYASFSSNEIGAIWVVTRVLRYQANFGFRQSTSHVSVLMTPGQPSPEENEGLFCIRPLTPPMPVASCDGRSSGHELILAAAQTPAHITSWYNLSQVFTVHLPMAVDYNLPPVPHPLEISSLSILLSLALGSFPISIDDYS